MTQSSVLLLTCPRELATQLIDAELAAPYLREERANPSLSTAIILAASAASTTVIITSITTDLIRRLAQTLRGWFSRQHGRSQVQIVIHDDGRSITRTIGVTTTVTNEELLSLIEKAVRREFPSAGPAEGE